jgi:translation initiation factor 4G
MGFRRILLNTCQDAFEAAAEARQVAIDGTDSDQEAAERRAKARTLGNIRLIGELFKKTVVPEKIVHMCMMELMGDPKSSVLREENVEAVCELVTIAGKALDAASKQGKDRMNEYFATLERWQKSKALSSRVRFMVKDVIELRRSAWIPRREVLQAKKLEEIHAEAHAELGMMPTTLIPALESLAPLPKTVHDEVELFPGFKGGEDWQRLMGTGSSGKPSNGGYSALTGEYQPVKPIEPAKPAKPAAPAQPSGQAAAPAAPKAPEPTAAAGALTEEQRDTKAKGLFSEYLGSADVQEAVTCAQEICTDEFRPKLLQMAIDQLYESMKPREHEMLAELMAQFQVQKVVSQQQLLDAVSEQTTALEDLSLDVPQAPKLLGLLVGQAVAAGALQLTALPNMLDGVESAKPKREFVAATLQRLKAKAGEAKMADQVKAAKLDLQSTLKADPEFDGNMPEVSKFLAQEGLKL